MEKIECGPFAPPRARCVVQWLKVRLVVLDALRGATLFPRKFPESRAAERSALNTVQLFEQKQQTNSWGGEQTKNKQLGAEQTVGLEQPPGTATKTFLDEFVDQNPNLDA